MADAFPEIVARIERLEAKVGIDSTGSTVQTVGVTPVPTGPATVMAVEAAPDSIGRSDLTNTPSTVPTPPANTPSSPVDATSSGTTASSSTTSSGKSNKNS